MKLIAILFLLIASVAQAQGQNTRPATEADFVGHWRVVLIPDEVHGSAFKNEQMGYSDPCQFFVHKPDGTWHNISINNLAGAEASRRNCPTTQSLVDVALITAAPQFRWNKAPNQNGLFLIQNTAATAPQSQRGLLWKADLVLTDLPSTPAFEFEMKQGDMLMQVTRLMAGNNIAPVWPMVLRRVPK